MIGWPGEFSPGPDVPNAAPGFFLRAGHRMCGFPRPPNFRRAGPLFFSAAKWRLAGARDGGRRFVRQECRVDGEIATTKGQDVMKRSFTILTDCKLRFSKTPTANRSGFVTIHHIQTGDVGRKVALPAHKDAVRALPG